ncbi:unnamed protein product [Calypogeia fissa]
MKEATGRRLGKSIRPRNEQTWGTSRGTWGWSGDGGVGVGGATVLLYGAPGWGQGAPGGSAVGAFLCLWLGSVGGVEGSVTPEGVRGLGVFFFRGTVPRTRTQSGKWGTVLLSNMDETHQYSTYLLRRLPTRCKQTTQYPDGRIFFRFG